jgi:hypothetical protein
VKQEVEQLLAEVRQWRAEAVTKLEKTRVDGEPPRGAMAEPFRYNQGEADSYAVIEARLDAILRSSR